SGEILGWGDNSEGQLGVDPQTLTAHVPVSIPAPKGTIKVLTNGEHSFALKADGEVMVWGSCALLDEAVAPKNYIPTFAKHITDARTISANFIDVTSPTPYLKRDGSIWTIDVNPFSFTPNGQTCRPRSNLLFRPVPPFKAIGLDTPATEVVLHGLTGA